VVVVVLAVPEKGHCRGLVTQEATAVEAGAVVVVVPGLDLRHLVRGVLVVVLHLEIGDQEGHHLGGTNLGGPHGDDCCVVDDGSSDFFSADLVAAYFYIHTINALYIYP
jgi:hypothetical protein